MRPSRSARLRHSPLSQPVHMHPRNCSPMNSPGSAPRTPEAVLRRSCPCTLAKLRLLQAPPGGGAKYHESMGTQLQSVFLQHRTTCFSTNLGTDVRSPRGQAPQNSEVRKPAPRRDHITNGGNGQWCLGSNHGLLNANPASAQQRRRGGQ